MFFLAWLISTLAINCLRRQDDKDGKLEAPVPIKDLSTSEMLQLCTQAPSVDHVVLFYITLNSNCRNFVNIYNTLVHQFGSEGKAIRFVKFNCQGATKKFELCHEYNIKAVPTLAYISNHVIQREYLPSKSPPRRVLDYLTSNKHDDIRLPNGTVYKGDLFVYEELRDWISIMYALSSIHRRMQGMSLDRAVRSLWSALTSLLGRP